MGGILTPIHRYIEVQVVVPAATITLPTQCKRKLEFPVYVLSVFSCLINVVTVLLLKLTSRDLWRHEVQTTGHHRWCFI